MTRRFFWGLALALLVSCAGVKSDDPDAINDALVGFTTCVQSSRWAEALRYVTPSEANAISEGGVFMPEYQQAASRLRLSTMKRMEWSIDSKGRLIGIKALLDETNGKFVVSEGQSKIGTKEYFDKVEQRHVQQKLEEGRRIMEEEESVHNQNSEVEVMSNRLTDEEKRKYGSTGDLMAPEEYSDENTQAANESMYGSSEDSSSDAFGEEEGYYGD